MLFIDNKYTRWYYSIIQKSHPKTGYTESHHIIPKSLGGSDDYTNIVKLTAKEHFICHLLLVKMTTGIHKSKMSQAAWMMVSASKWHERYKVTSKTYQILKEQMSIAKKDVSTWNKGISPSDDTKKKLRAASLNHLVIQGKISKEEAEFINSQPLGYKRATVKKGRSPGGWKWSAEAKQKLSESRLGRTPWNKGKGRI